MSRDECPVTSRPSGQLGRDMQLDCHGHGTRVRSRPTVLKVTTVHSQSILNVSWVALTSICRGTRDTFWRQLTNIRSDDVWNITKNAGLCFWEYCRLIGWI
jgi:hypothetical protein